MAAPDDTRRRKARAAWGYSGKDQKEFAGVAGVTYARLRGIIGDPPRGPGPSLDELHQLADAAGMDRAFMDDSFGGAEASGLSALRESIAELLALTAQHTQELEELRAWRRRQELGGDGGRGRRGPRP